jgi:hypothetical protein
MSDPVVSPQPSDSETRSHRGQSLVELGLILPLLLLITGGIVQYATLIASKHTLTQIGRDVGRWAATHGTDPCEGLALEDQPAIRADEIAIASHLMGYVPDTWVDNFTSYDVAPMPSTQPTVAGAEVAWEVVDGACPPVDSTEAAFVTIRLAYEAPVLVPGIEYVPGIGTCDGTGCSLLLTTTAMYRMEPQALPAATSP